MSKIIIFLILSLIQYAILICFLKYFGAFHPIYKLTPDTHQNKIETPSFGGLGILLSLILGVLIFRIWTPKIIWVLGLITAFTLIGFLDDLIATIRHKNKGLTVWQKLILETIFGAIALYIYFYLFQPVNIWTTLFYLFVIVGAANATNLSDGLDGLLAGLSIFTLIGFFYAFLIMGFDPETRFSLIFILSMICFLVFNFLPAKIFMGDTGSLALGAAFAGLGIIINNPWVLVPFGAVYIIETLSVILQVFWFKLTGKRVFLMAPLHHHFEMQGFKEKTIVFFFWSAALFFMLIYFSVRMV